MTNAKRAAKFVADRKAIRAAFAAAEARPGNRTQYDRGTSIFAELARAGFRIVRVPRERTGTIA
jgi:hypothetical protein